MGRVLDDHDPERFDRRDLIATHSVGVFESGSQPPPGAVRRFGAHRGNDQGDTAVTHGVKERLLGTSECVAQEDAEGVEREVGAAVPAGPVGVRLPH